MRIVIVLALLAACGDKKKATPPDPNQATCEHYAKLFRDCHASEGNPAIAQDTAQNLCLKGLSGQHEDMFGPKYRAMIECSKTATTCDALEKCDQAGE
jgi:hypothetical protein